MTEQTERLIAEMEIEKKERASEQAEKKKGVNMKKNKCEDCEGLGYFTDVDAIGINDPKDPYYYPHTERCDRCLVFKSDKEADDFLKRGSVSLPIAKQGSS